MGNILVPQQNKNKNVETFWGTPGERGPRGDTGPKGANGKNGANGKRLASP